ncbi:MAG: amidohydrolase family protein [Alphaproteobacteria bacterium]|nr:amidohydrolase family protein [Alphaproteobacteria bacterium]
MTYDLVIRNGTLVDGTGAASRRGDVAIAGDRIVAVGKVEGTARETVDAEGHLVTPGFVDIHTHLDAQITWDPIASSSCWHGVTSVVMGNCGVTFAPCKPQDREYLAKLMESVEDVPARSIASGMPWTWETYGQYLAALKDLPKGVNVGGLVGHCAVRLYAMGEEALANKPASAEQIAAMRDAVSEALAGGALGFSTSRTPLHLTPQGDAVPGTYATAEELKGISAALREQGRGVLEAATRMSGPDEATLRANLDSEMAWMTEISRETGRPVIFNLTQTRQVPHGYRLILDAVAQNTKKGARIVAQSTTRGIGVLFGFQNRTPFDRAPAWRALRGQSLADKLARLRDPEYRATMVRQSLADMPPMDWHDLFLLSRANPRYDHAPADSLAAHAARLNTSPPDAFIELSLAEDGMALFNYPFLNPDMTAVEEMLDDPHVVLGLGDAGAHCGMIMDASLPTYFLTYWVRERGHFAIEQAIHMLTGEPAALFGIRDRGVLAPGMKADVNVIDFDRLRLHGPQFVHDFPAGAGRYIQKADGYARTYVNGQLFMQGGVHAGALAGEMLRGG